MGASAWSHFGPYSNNLVEAFEATCQKVFADGDYYNLWLPPEEERARVEQYIDEVIAFTGLERTLARYRENDKGIIPASREDIVSLLMREQAEPPQSNEDLLAYNGRTGTHSILDYYLAFRTTGVPPLKPISTQALLRLFGTDRPTRPIIEMAGKRLWDYVLNDPEGESEGNYIVVYKADRPAEIYVMGITGG